MPKNNQKTVKNVKKSRLVARLGWLRVLLVDFPRFLQPISESRTQSLFQCNGKGSYKITYGKIEYKVTAQFNKGSKFNYPRIPFRRSEVVCFCIAQSERELTVIQALSFGTKVTFSTMSIPSASLCSNLILGFLVPFSKTLDFKKDFPMFYRITYSIKFEYKKQSGIFLFYEDVAIEPQPE